MKKKEQNDIVTIIVLSYNNSNYILNTLESIKSQEYSNIELIIIDDYSRDNSVDAIQEWIKVNSVHCEFIIHAENRGLTYSCNEGLNLAKGNYFCVIGSDDIMCSNRIRLQVEFLENSREEEAAVFSDMYLIDENGNKDTLLFLKKINTSYSEVDDFIRSNLDNQLSKLISFNIIPAPAMLYKKSALIKIGGYDTNLSFEDLDTNLRLLREGYKFSFIKDSLISYRILANSVSHNYSAKYLYSFMEAIYKHRGLSDKVDEAINNRVDSFAELHYQLGGVNSAKWLWHKFIYKPRLRNALMFFLALLGISYSKIIGVKNLLC